MRRIYAIWLARIFVSPLFLKLYAIAALSIGITRYVSVRDVLSNAPAWNDFGAQYNFFTGAISHTESMVFALSFGCLFCLAWISVDVFVKKTA